MMKRITLLVVVAAVAGGCKLFGDSREETEEAIASLPSMPDGPARGRTTEIRVKEVEEFVLESWLDPQNRGDVDGYLASLSKDFVGTVLDTTGNPETLDRDQWVKRRSKALKRRPVITLEELTVKDVSDPESIEVTFDQTWETDTYCDRGSKSLQVRARDDSFVVTREAMQTVQECPWVSMASLLTFVDNYRMAVRKGEAEYLAAHTCIPFVVERLEGEAEARIQEIQEVADVPKDLVEDVRPGPRPRKQEIQYTEWEVSVEVMAHDATVFLDAGDGQSSHSFIFVFEEDRWKYCKHVQTVASPPAGEEEPAGQEVPAEQEEPPAAGAPAQEVTPSAG